MLELDEETRALLGWGLTPMHEVSTAEAGALLSDNTTPLAIREAREIATREIDGRHRRNWRHRRQS